LRGWVKLTAETTAGGGTGVNSVDRMRGRQQEHQDRDRNLSGFGDQIIDSGDDFDQPVHPSCGEGNRR
jgi:hypothetical protein